LWFEACAGRSDEDVVFPAVAAMQKAIRRTTADVPLGLNPARLEAANISPKLMRKWFASKVAADQPEHVLQRLLGHAPGSPITRRHYVRSTDEQVERAAAGVTL
jgi:integrase